MWSVLKFIPVMIAAIIIGNWFMKEVTKARIKGEPWYAPYQTIPGILIIIAIFLPIFLWIFGIL